MDRQIATLAGSIRVGSLNVQLARLAAEALRHRGVGSVFINLSLHQLPLYNADLENADGIPVQAVDIAERIQLADGLVIASPEYNGAYTALLKNVIDWVTRVDYSAWARPIALVSATPGRSGGRRGLSVLRSTFEHMGVPVVEEQLTLGSADSRLFDGRLVEDADQVQLDKVVDDLLSATVSEAA